MLWLMLAMGCGPPTGPGNVLWQPGEDGPFGAAWLRTRVQSRVTDTIDVEVVFPALSDGMPDDDALPAPPVLMLQGGLVDTARYRWLAAHLAAQGQVVVMPEHPADLAFFAVENGLIAVDGVADGGGVLAGMTSTEHPAVVMGHSLGGVAAAILFEAQPRIAGLVMLASYPAQSTAVEQREGPVLVLTGSHDLSSTLAEVEQGWARFAGPRWLGVIEGMGHYGWTDDDSPSDLQKGGDQQPGARSDDETRSAALPPLDAFVQAALTDDPADWDVLEAGDFSGVTWSP